MESTKYSIVVRGWLKAVLPTLAAGRDYSTAEIAALIGPPDDAKEIFRALMMIAGRCPGLCTRGPERPGKAWATGKMVRPWIWRHIPADKVEGLLTPNSAVSLSDRVADLERRVAQLEGPNENQA